MTEDETIAPEVGAAWVAEHIDRIERDVRAALSEGDQIRTPFVLLLPAGGEGTRMVSNMPEPAAMGIMQMTLQAWIAGKLGEALAAGRVHVIAIGGDDKPDEDEPAKVH